MENSLKIDFKNYYLSPYFVKGTGLGKLNKTRIKPGAIFKRKLL